MQVVKHSNRLLRETVDSASLKNMTRWGPQQSDHQVRFVLTRMLDQMTSQDLFKPELLQNS